MKKGLIFILVFLLIGSLTIISAINCPDTVEIENCVAADCPDGYRLWGCAERNICMKEECDILLRISGFTNAHAEISTYTPMQYTSGISYTSIFGSSYQGIDPYVCTGDNLILKLSSETNAHAEIERCEGAAISCSGLDEAECNEQDGCIWHERIWPLSDECEGSVRACDTYYESTECEQQLGCNWNQGSYPVEICFGDLNCRLAEDSDCSENEKCIVKLSSKTNAHLETCDNENYAYSVCCSSIGEITDCESYTTKQECWSAPANCTWTPPFNYETGLETTSHSDGGGCCPKDKPVWDSWNEVCTETGYDICTMPVIQGQPLNIGENGPIRAKTNPTSDAEYEYCAQVTSGMNYGLWYDVKKY